MNTNELREYAWDWFEYHAGQRLTAFRFFLIILGALIVGFSTGLRYGNGFFTSVVGLVGIFLSVAFFCLEIRNEELVNVGRNALIDLEEFDESLKAHPKLQLLHRDRSRNILLSHKFWLRAIYLFCAVLFLVGALYPMIVRTAS